MDVVLSEKYEPLFELLSCRKELEDNPEDERLQELSKVDTIIISGGRDCFKGNQEVVSVDGVKKIKDVKPGDVLLTYNEKTKKKEYRKVFKTRKVQKSEIIRINLKDGSVIECTPDHEFYSNGCWVKVKDLLSLWYGNMEEDRKI